VLRVAILDDYQRVALRMANWQPIESACSIQVFEHPIGTVEQAVAALSEFQIICLMRERMPFPRALLERLPQLKLVVVTGTHNRTLDLSAVNDHGITVCHTRGGGTEHCTSELTWALILASARHLTYEDRAMRDGKWQSTVGMTLHGKTLGVLGLGRIGSIVATIGRAFGMKIIAWSPHLTGERVAAAEGRLVSKEELLAKSDVLTIHMVLSESTHGLIGAKELASMHSHAVLVNTSRGPIVDEAALIQALQDKRIGGAALDAFDCEPLRTDHPFRKLDNIVLTPHLGYVCQETYAIYFNDVVEDICAYLAGAPIRVLSANNSSDRFDGKKLGMEHVLDRSHPNAGAVR
jgi:phosphoglycerate dehydrogenase-like enzyme